MSTDSWRFVRGAWQLYCALEQIEGNRRAREAEARAIDAEHRMRESLDEARRVRAFIEREEVSDKLGAGRLGNLDDAARLDMLDPEGIFLGSLEGKPLFYNGPGHILNYGPTQTGKGRDLVLTNLAHVENRSVVVSDIKNGENAYASAAHRKSKFGHRIIPLNPHGLHGFPTFRLNPFQRMIDHAQGGLSIAIETQQAALSLVPPKDGHDSWVAEGAQDLISLLIEHRARFMPDRCTPSELWRFAYGDTAEMLETIGCCGVEAIEMAAESNLRCMNDAPEQWSAYASELRKAARSFRPGEPLATITDRSDFDPASMREEETTVYLMSAENQLEASARWISLTIGSILETLANTQGEVKTLFLIDELANLPYMAVIPKALTLYAGLGIQLFGLCQGRNSLAARGYGQATIKVFEEQAGLFSMWGVEDTTLLRDVEAWSGKMGVAIRGVNNSGGQVASASFGLTEHARPVLQAEDIRAVNEGRQILRLMGNHLFVADRVPWYTVRQWAGSLADVRELHHTAKAPKRPLLPAPAPARLLPPPDGWTPPPPASAAPAAPTRAQELQLHYARNPATEPPWPCGATGGCPLEFGRREETECPVGITLPEFNRTPKRLARPVTPPPVVEQKPIAASVASTPVVESDTPWRAQIEKFQRESLQASAQEMIALRRQYSHVKATKKDLIGWGIIEDAKSFNEIRRSSKRFISWFRRT